MNKFTQLPIIRISIFLMMGCVVACSGSKESTLTQRERVEKEYQEIPVPPSVISEEYPKPDVWAKYPGGEEHLIRQIVQNTRIPAEVFKKGETGRLIITYIVDASGSVRDVEVKMSPSDIVSKLYKQTIQNLEKWEPALKDGEPIAQRYIYISMIKNSTEESGKPQNN